MRPSEAADKLIQVRVSAITRLTRSALQFTLRADSVLPEVLPGAHIDVHMQDGMVRQYSLITPLCDASHYVVVVKREEAGRGGSRWLHDQVAQGMDLRISVPRNHFELADTTAPILLLAGGIGITPIYAMFGHLQALNRDVVLHYWCAGLEDTLFLEELEGTVGVSLHYPSDARLQAGQVVAAAPQGATIYCCGPERMLQDCEAALRPDCYLRSERFLPAAAAEAEAADFVVHLARSGKDVAVARDKTILAALLEMDMDVQYSCEEGVCGACETIVLEGEAVHLDAVRSAADHDRLKTIMICCSRAKAGRLTLDL